MIQRIKGILETLIMHQSQACFVYCLAGMKVLIFLIFHFVTIQH